MKVWLDDERPAPDDSWVEVSWASEAIVFVESGRVTEISFDHDLGEKRGTGYEVAKYIEHGAARGTVPRLEWHIHSANPVGRANIAAAMAAAERFWAMTGEQCNG